MVDPRKLREWGKRTREEHATLSGKEAYYAVFFDHLDELIASNPRAVVIKEVKKMLKCGDPASGTFYMCPDCGNMEFVPHTCKSRMCPSCGNLYNMQRCNSICERMLNVIHRQWVFTTPISIRHYFDEIRRLLHLLFDAAYLTIKATFDKINPSMGNMPGIVSVLHTFGRANNWVPHVHCIVTDGAINKYGNWFSISFLNYKDIRITYRDILLDLMTRELGPSFAAEAEELKKKYPNGFVVNAPNNRNQKTYSSSGQDLDDYCDVEDFEANLNCVDVKSIKRVVKYTARYVGRPSFATSRLDSYDGKNVTYHYTDHRKNEVRHKKSPCRERRHHT